jgi:hypothetical protein
MKQFRDSGAALLLTIVDLGAVIWGSMLYKTVVKRTPRVAIIAATFLFAGATAKASPWAEPGDVQLRSDIEILANAGLIDGITTQWPLPWPGC